MKTIQIFLSLFGYFPNQGLIIQFEDILNSSKKNNQKNITTAIPSLR